MIEVPARPKARTKKTPQDTAVGCRMRAEADLLVSVAMLTANQRARLEASAAVWSARARLLEVLEERFAARSHSGALPADEANDRKVRL